MENLQAYIRKILNESLEESKRPIRKVAGALIKDEDSGEVLLIKRNDKTPRWAMVTGEFDEGEDALDALEREMYEELFIRPGKVRLNFKGVDKFPSQNIELYYFEGFVNGRFKPHLDEENLDFGWFSMENLPSPLMNGTYVRVNDITKNEMKYSDTKQVAEGGIINEYITNNEVYIKDYFSQSEESKKAYLPHEFYYFFEDFLVEEDIYFERPKEMAQSNYEDEPDEEVDMFDNDIDLVIWLEKHNKELYNAFSEYLYKKIIHNELPIPESDYPAWAYFDNNPFIVKNQWLIHFTDNAEGIASNGFKYGVDDMTKLGLTTHLGEFDKKYGGYNFAYLLSDFPRYAHSNNRGSGYKYGKEAVIFRASGIKLWHHGDQEPQVIFYGNTANNFIPITEGDSEKWAIRSKNGRILFENNNLERVVLWLTKNYEQYRKQLNEKENKNPNRLSFFEARRQVRLIMEQKVMPKYYLQEAVSLLKEAEEKSPTFSWDFIGDDEKSPVYHWDLRDKESGVKDDISPIYQWDLSQDKPKLDSYEIAKEYIDKALSYIKDKANALEFIKDLQQYIKELSFASKIKITKYVATALLGIIGFGTMISLLSNSSSEVEREAVKTIVANKDSKEKMATAGQSNQEIKSYPTKSSEGLIEHLKTSEGYNSTFYDLRDGAYTVGWGHAVFASASKGSTGGDYDFVPKFHDITPDVTMLLSAEDMESVKGLEDDEKEQKMLQLAEINAEQLLRDDIKKAEQKLNEILSDWESQGIEVKIDQDMYDAMISMVFNMGAGKKFRTSDFIQYVKKGDLEKAYHAIDKIDSPKLLAKYPGLKDRREKEKAMFGSSLASASQKDNPDNISEIKKIIRNILKEYIL